MSTKALLLVGAVSAIAVALQIPGILSQGRGARMNANLMDIGVSVVGVTACIVLGMIKNARARNSGQ